MALTDDLQKEVAAIFRAVWERRVGTVVPADDSLRLGNDAVELEATVLYADLADSTKLVDGHIPAFAAEVIRHSFIAPQRLFGKKAEQSRHLTATVLWQFILGMQRTRQQLGPL